MPGTKRSHSGAIVAAGTVGGEGVVVDAGSYTVRVLSNPPVLFREVRVTRDQPTEVNLK